MAEVRIIDVTPPGWGEKLIAAFLVVGGERSVLVETGPRSSSGKLLEALERLGVRPDYVLVTHIHLDHGGGAGTIARSLGATVLVHPRGYKHLLNPSKLWSASRAVLGGIAEIYGEPEPVPEGKLIALGDGSRISLGGSHLRVIHTPGHASHHMVALLEPEGILFTGDAAGVSVEIDGRRIRLPTTPPPFKAEPYIESLQRMAELQPRKVAPTHYGIDPLDGKEYLERHLGEVHRWLRAVEELVRQGVTDPAKAAEILAQRLEEARVALESGNPIIVETFYKSTVWGMVEYFREKLGGLTPAPAGGEQCEPCR